MIINELLDMLPAEVPLFIVTPSAAAIMQDWVDRHPALNAGIRHRIVVGTTLPAPVDPEKFAVALVANRSPDHFAAAAKLLSAGYHVLVEKPLATDPGHARHLVWLADHLQRALVVGLNQLFAPYLRAFVETLPFPSEAIASFEVEWGDPTIELRYGEEKRVSPGTGIALDYLPHVWSVLRTVFPASVATQVRIEQIDAGGAELTLYARTGGAEGKIRLSRRAPQRRRLLQLRTNAMQASLDFAQDPVIAMIDGERLLFPERPAQGGALAHQLAFFFGYARQVQCGVQVDAHSAVGRHCLEHVELAYGIEHTLRCEQERIVRSRLAEVPVAESALYALRELLGDAGGDLSERQDDGNNPLRSV